MHIQLLFFLADYYLHSLPLRYFAHRCSVSLARFRSDSYRLRLSPHRIIHHKIIYNRRKIRYMPQKKESGGKMMANPPLYFVRS